MLKNKKGFTLIELMVVVLILGILSAILVPNYRSTTIKARIATNMPLLRALQNDIINYYHLTGDLPTRLNQLSINTGDFQIEDDISGTHLGTECTITLKTDNGVSNITEDCNQNWELVYPVNKSFNSANTRMIGYHIGNPTFRITGGDRPMLRKVANSFGWTPLNNNDNEYRVN